MTSAVPAPICVKSSLGLEVWLQNPELARFVTEPWSPSLAKQARTLLDKTLSIPLTERGFVQASNRAESGDPTNYDAVWVRDSMWVYHAFSQEGRKAEARQVVEALLDYFSTSDQLARMNRVIERPEIIEGSSGPMQVLHIRFNGTSPTMDDVQVNGEPQFWNHKQNDALGIFYAAVAECLSAGLIAPQDISRDAWKFLVRLPTYFESVHYFDMADSGAWEELERINSSSIALVTDSLERWRELFVGSLRDPVIGSLRDIAHDLSGIDPSAEALGNARRMQALIDGGYRRLFAQLPGESPTHPRESLQYRDSDAALLNLLYPCKLDRLPLETLVDVVANVEKLRGDRGIRRYFNDAYQSGNYWIKDLASSGLKGVDSWTDDCSSPDDFAKRTSNMLQDTEAQWFFDSWLAYGLKRLSKRADVSATDRADFERKSVHYLHRALGQITPGYVSTGADGKSVQSWACPESYNTLVSSNGERSFAPSPITPLNWAKASLILALRSWCE